MKVFISHAATDAKLAKRVAHVLREAGFQVWDETHIFPGDNWGTQLAEALQESEAMVVLLTPNSLHSPSLSHEVGYALGKEGYKGRVIPVLAGSPEQLPKEDIPWILQKFHMIHLQDQEKDEEGLRSIAQALQDAA
jgi:methylmalonyl-CoA mutase cobalamin-binding subunit